MKKVAVIMGSDSDLAVAEKAAAQLKELGIPFTVRVMSAHRTPDEACAFARTPRKRVSACSFRLPAWRRT